MKKVLVVAVILLTLFLYTSFIEPNLLVTERKTLNDQRNSKSSLKIIQFTDTQLGPFYSLEQLENVVIQINKEKPDVIVFTGDLFDTPRAYDEKDKTLEILKTLEDQALKIAIFGNHDIGGGGKAIYEDFMSEAGFVVLVNASFSYEMTNERSIDFYGIDDGMLGQPDFGFIKNQIDASHYNILLVHEPDLYSNVLEEPFDLILAGHSHGGQISLPFIGPILTPPLAKIYTHGYYEIENDRKSLLYVNTGIGNTKMRYRFGNVPKITVFTIE